MGYEKWYSTTSKDTSHHSILEFFGFRLTSEKATQLKALKTTNYVKVDSETYVKETKTVGFTSEDAGYYDIRLERDYATGEDKVLEERFIEAVRKEGKNPFAYDFIWDGPSLCKSIDSYYYGRYSKPIWTLLLTVLAALLALAQVGYGVYQYYLAYEANLNTDASISMILKAIFGGLVLVFLTYVFFSNMFEIKPLCKRSKEFQEQIHKEYLDSLGSSFSSETGAVLKEYAIRHKYDQSRITGSGKVAFAIVFFLVIGAATLFWREVATVQIYRVTDVTVTGESGYRTTYDISYAGFVTEVANYNAKGEMTDYVEYDVNTLGVLEESAEHTVSKGKDKQVSRTYYTDNFSGYTQTARVINMSGKELTKIVRNFNGRNLIEQERLDVEGKVNSGYECEYDKKLLLKKTEYGFENKEKYVVAVSTYSYDDDGNQIGCEVYRGEQLFSRTTREFFEDLVLTETYCEYGKDGEKTLTKKTVYMYNSQAQLTKVAEYQDEAMLGYKILRYNEDGTVHQVIFYDANGQETGTTITYSYMTRRMYAPRATRFLREWGEELVYIDKGLF